ncbi:hypothetical protein F5146DRAFT_997627 [Armillaria mellea]|nr:hypothetical protein F5146DRAFT_997627 [Armillaria mellea]
MSSLSNYDSVVPTQQHDSTTPIKDVVDDTFEQWLHSLKSLVADAPVQIQINESEVLNQQLHRELKHKQAVGLHEHRVLRTRLSQHHVHLRAQESYIAAISNATIRDLPPMTQNIECFKPKGYRVQMHYRLAHFLEENSSTIADSWTDISVPHERHDGTATIKKHDLHCPLCQGAVCWKPHSIPIMESVCRALNTTEAGSGTLRSLVVEGQCIRVAGPSPVFFFRESNLLPQMPHFLGSFATEVTANNRHVLIEASRTDEDTRTVKTMKDAMRPWVFYLR